MEESIQNDSYLGIHVFGVELDQQAAESRLRRRSVSVDLFVAVEVDRILRHHDTHVTWCQTLSGAAGSGAANVLAWLE